MAVSSLRSIVDGSFVRKFQGLATGTSVTTKGDSSSTTIQNGLRVGAQTFARAIQGLNGVISFLNNGRATLEGVLKITDKMIDLAERAKKISTSSDGRENINDEFVRLSRDYEKLVDTAKFGDRELITTEGISGIFEVLGLDKGASESIAAVFERFVTPKDDDNLASEKARGTRPYSPPANAYVTASGNTLAKSTREYDEIFDRTIDLTTRPGAYKMAHDLEGLKKQLTDNLKAVDYATEIVGKNIDLVRAAGFAFLDLSNQVDESDADKIAEKLRSMIRKDAKGAMSQAENLESIVVAALAFESSDLTSNS